jgi:hypothetical protein
MKGAFQMEELIEALTIFLKYGNPKYPTHCEHDQLSVVDIPFDIVSSEDIAKLETLGFHWDDSIGCFISYRFGSA